MHAGAHACKRMPDEHAMMSPDGAVQNKSFHSTDATAGQ